MHLFSTSLLAFSALSFLAACSDSNNGSSSTSNIEGWVGAQGFNSAQVVVNQVAESGQVAVNTDGIYLGLRESTDSRSRFTATVANDETLLFIARGQVANVDKDKNNIASLRQCQLYNGCVVSGENFAHGNYYPLTSGFEWRSVAYTVSDGSRNNVNPITTLAAAYAYQYDVLNYPDDGNLAENTIFSPYDVVLANSQVSKLLGIDDIIGDLPANLTQLNNFNSNTADVRNQIRYGALISAFQSLELDYLQTQSLAVDTGFVREFANQFTMDVGQFYYHSPAVERLVTLESLYQAAHENLNAISQGITNSKAKEAVNHVISDFADQIASVQSQPADNKTQVTADDLSQLLTESELADINLGLEKTKLFVNSLLDYQQTFWQSGYKTELDEYLNYLKTIGDEHKDNLNALVAEFAHIQDYYVTCILAGSECDTRFADLEARKVGFDSLTKVLTLDGGELVVSQKIADLNLQDNIDEPTESHAMDIFITGKLEKNNLVLTINHDLDASEENIDVPAAMRIFYSQAVSSVDPSLEIKGYELIWGEFQLYDKSKLGTAETELSGAFRIFYRGVQDPQNTNEPNDSELRFNIEDWVLSSTISDKVNDDVENDREVTSLLVTASASNPVDYYPAKKLASFNGFFTPNNAHQVDDVETGLLTYQLGTEEVPFGNGLISVQTVDFINALDDDLRYRFYPDEKVEDEFDIDGDGNVKELVDMHRIEECKLSEETGNVSTCGPKTKVFEKRNLQNTINNFWELGLFQKVSIPGRGTYFIDFPTVTDSNGCLVLDTLVADQPAMDGRLIEQQVLGLDSVRVFSEINIEDEQQIDLPKTLLDMTVVAPTQDKYRISAALSHNYTETTADNSGLIFGAGDNASVLAVSYDTSADFEDAGNLSIAKAGVTLNLGDGSSVAENQDITAFLSQTYDPASVHYKILEDEEGKSDRCVLSVGTPYVKDPANLEQVFYLNYRDAVYGTARPEGVNNLWTIRYIDGSWLIPSDGSSGN
jgi:hypothetical protein